MWWLFKMFSVLKGPSNITYQDWHPSWPSTAPTLVFIVFLKYNIHYFSLESCTVERFSLFDVYYSGHTNTDGWAHQHPSVWLAHFRSPPCVKVEAVRSGLCSAEWSKLPSGHFPFHSFPVFFSFLHWHERQCVLKLDNFFVWSVDCAVEALFNAPLVSPLFSHVPLLFLTPTPILSPHTPMCLTCAPHFTMFLSSLLLLSPFTFIRLSPASRAPVSLQTAERISTKESYSSPHSAPSITSTGYSPWNTAEAHTHTHTHTNSLGSTLRNWHTHAPDKQVNNLLPENSVWVLN